MADFVDARAAAVKLLLTLVLAVVLAGCGSAAATSAQARRVLLVDEKVRVANLGDPSALAEVAIRDIVIHDRTRLNADTVELLLTYTVVRPDGVMRRDRRVFVRESRKEDSLIGQCSPTSPATCEHLRRRFAG